MSVTDRKVKNKKNIDGTKSGRAGTVYDVNMKYKDADGNFQSYGKRGFLTKPEAVAHEAEMIKKLSYGGYEPSKIAEGKQTVKQYLDTWVESHGAANLRPSTFAGYKSHIKNQIVPHIGAVPLNKLSPKMIDDMIAKLYDQKLSHSTIRYSQRILSVAFEAARKYGYIESNPARDIITKIGSAVETPDPYTIEQMQKLMSKSAGTEWEMMIVLSGMYGLRLNEVLGLRWQNVDLQKGMISVVEQLPFKLPAGTTIITDVAEMEPPKSYDRYLPITDITRPYFERHLALQNRQKELASLGGSEYYDNNLVIAKTDGRPYKRDQTSGKWGQFIRRLEMPHLRFHDLRHSAATNMHELTGDFYTVGQILGHSLKGIGLSLGISTNMADITARYVDVRQSRMNIVMEAYHNALHEKERIKPYKQKPNRDAR